MQRHFSKKQGYTTISQILQLKTHVRHKELINMIRNYIIPFLITTHPRWRPRSQAFPPSENHLYAIIIIFETFFSEPCNLEYISTTNFFYIMCLSAQNPTWMPYWLPLFSAGAVIKRCPTAFSYGDIDIDLSNLQNIIYQK